MEVKRKNPISRNNLFYSEEDFLFEQEIGMNYIEQDVNQTIVLYEIDRERTNVSDIYKEARSGDIMFKTPVEINVIFELDGAKLMSYNNQHITGFYLQTGKLVFGVYEESLRETDSDINRGDYIGLQVTNDHVEYFVVTNDGRINYDNKHTMYGYKSFYRTIECAVVDRNEFDGR